MSEPKRWLDQGAPRDVEHLVRAAQAEHPDRASLARSLSAVGIGLGATSVAAGAKAAGTVASVGGTAKAAMPITGGLLVKWTALGATVGTLAVGAAQIATEAPRAVQAPTSSVRPAARPRPVSVPGAARAVAAPATTLPGARVALAAPTADAPRDVVLAAPTADAPRDVAPTAPTAAVQREAIASTPAAALTRLAVPEAAPGSAGPRPVAPEAPAASAAPLDAETLAEEVESVDRARAALAAGQAAQTLVVLDEYERRFRKRGFAPEALYLRMEAYTSLGRTAEARTAAERLLTNYPNSLHAPRARAVLTKDP